MGGFALGMTGYGWASTRHFVVSRHRMGLRGLSKPLRIVQLSDLHFGRFYGLKEVKDWVRSALQQQPDVIVLTGDIVDGPISHAEQGQLSSVLGRLDAPLGVFSVLGNHDYFRRNGTREEGVGSLVRQLERVGVRYLINAGVALRDDVYLAGVDDLWKGQVDLPKALEAVPSEGAAILLSHNPDLLPVMPSRVDLTLCGHTHGGQICAPFGIQLHSVSRYRFQSGFIETPSLGFISRGLGTTGPPLRTFCSAEMVVLDLEPVKG